uniref:Uncharacterized protein n=1 Tax=Mycena chlorophos TaxID=658473 RepID=A0ABQ0L4I6_MYCCL|nr:predicted protein [Mycena chlorophos]
MARITNDGDTGCLGFLAPFVDVAALALPLQEHKFDEKKRKTQTDLMTGIGYREKRAVDGSDESVDEWAKAGWVEGRMN